MVPRVVKAGEEIGFSDPGGKSVLRYGSLYAVDADGRALRTAMRLVSVRDASGVAGHRIRLEVEDQDAAYPLLMLSRAAVSRQKDSAVVWNQAISRGPPGG